jgi:transitional endoplasmic reticulum ATPase
LEILQILTENLDFDDSVDLNYFAERCCGFLASDLFNMIQFVSKREFNYYIDDFLLKFAMCEVHPSLLSEYPKKPNISLSDFGFSSEFKNQHLSKILNSINNIEESVNGYLFHGTKSNGKTMFANALSNETHHCFISISGSTTNEYSKFKDAFTKAMEVSPSILFIDNIDKVNNSMDLIIEDIKECKGKVLVVAASKSIEFPKELLELLSPIEFNSPNEESRIAIMKSSFRKFFVQKSFPWEEISKQTEGINGKELACICELAAQLSFETAEKNNLNLEEGSPEYLAMITSIDFQNAILTIYPVSDKILHQ